MEAKSSRIISVSATIVTMLLGFTVITGWIVHDDLLRSIVHGAAKMKFNAALNLIFCSIVLLLHHFGNKSRPQHLVTVFLSVLVSLIGSLTLAEYLFNVNLGIDELFVRDELRTTATYHAGRMSPLSSLNFLLIGIGLLMLDRERSAAYQFIYLFEIAFVALLMLISFNFVTDIPSFFRLSVQVAIGFIILSAAIYFAQPWLQEKINFENLVLAGFMAVISLTLVISTYTYYYNEERASSSHLIEHGNHLLMETEKTLSLAKDIESGARGYVIFNDSIYLEQDIRAEDSIFDHVKKLDELTRDNPAQQATVDSLSAVIKRRIDFSRQLVQLRNEKGFDAAREAMATMKGKIHTDRIRKLTAQIQQGEADLSIQRQKRNVESASVFNYAFRTLLICLAVLLATIFFVVRYNLVKRRKAEEHSRESEERIQTIFKAAPDAVIAIDEDGRIVKWNPKAESLFGWTEAVMIGQYLSDTIIPHRYRDAHKKGMLRFVGTGEGPVINKTIEIQALKKSNVEFDISLSISPTMVKGKYLFVAFIRDITEQKAAQEKIMALNSDLAQNIHKLEEANGELEAFSYSVSHDLRAPLRAIHGYTKMLQEDYTSQMDDEGKQMMSSVLRNSAKMGRLIDELLAFSKLGRKELQMSTIDMTRLAATVLNDIKYSLPSLKANVAIHPLGSATADSNLMNQVFANLISNAIKYSEVKESPAIEIGLKEEAGETVYYVKDNGVGFDMKYYDKLFGVFQRLHRDEEFEGTGVGLALVKRIITRHGGKIWAEAEAGKGATFYFSLNGIA